MVLQLIDKGVDLKGNDNVTRRAHPLSLLYLFQSGGSLLHSACRRGHLEIVTLLLQKGLEVNQLDTV
jgi:ankyrin repeat protein